MPDPQTNVPADDPGQMHTYSPATAALADEVITYTLERFAMNPPPLDGPRTPAELADQAGTAITPEGLGGAEALRLWVQVLAPACISQDHPRALSFVPSAPTDASALFDLVLGASSIYGGSWLEGAGAVHAENEALRWIAGLAGMPADAGGCFVSGGSAGNLSALVAARHTAAQARRSDTPGRGRRPRPDRWSIVASAEAHSSVASTARVMDIDILDVPVDERGRLTGDALRETLDGLERDQPEILDGLFAVVATGGTTNAGIVDDLTGVADVAAARHLWFHVDGAYGGAALAAPGARPHFAGIERADSLVIDPHKWLFTPFDCAALLYRRPALAKAAHTQEAAYLDVLHEGAHPDEWNPSDYAYHLSRRARGLPLWFSLATHGTEAYRRAVEASLEVTRAGAELIDALDHVELVTEPMLSVLLFRRPGWTPTDYRRWSDQALADGLTLTVPTTWQGETVLRFCIVNPRTTVEDLAAILTTMR